MQIGVDRLDRDEGDAASRLLARAFAADPIITFFLYGRLRRRIALPAFFHGVLEELLPSGHVYAARRDGRLIGVAAWKPPDAAEPDDEARRAAARHLRVVSWLFPCSSRELFEGFARLEPFHPHDPHWYLAFVGVDPSVQSTGIGRVLLSPVLSIADETGTRCYLETPFPRTHAFYGRQGFVRNGEPNTFVGAPPVVVSFLREPSPAAQARR
jgi:GNAT superfamily N-acetyltransferase